MAKERKVSVSIGLTAEQLNKIDELSSRNGSSISEHVRKAVDNYLKTETEKVNQ